MQYQIIVKEVMDEQWAGWFEDLDFSIHKNHEGFHATQLLVEVEDQAALHGILNRIRDLNLTLLFLTLLDRDTRSSV